MAVEFNNTPSLRVTPVQGIQMAKPVTEFFVGQILKAVVTNKLSHNEILLKINGQNVPAKTNHEFIRGEVLEVKVSDNKEDIILEILNRDNSSAILQNNLLKVLPKQAPPTHLMQLLTQLEQDARLPSHITQQIRALLNSIPSVTQLPQQLNQAIAQCGLFYESALWDFMRGFIQKNIVSDFKGQCLKLLSALPTNRRMDPSRAPKQDEKQLNQSHLPLPGAIPQPLPKSPLSDLSEYSLEGLLHQLREDIEQVVARITAHQINYLSHDQTNGFLIMFDLPVRTVHGIDIVPIQIQQHKAEPMQPSQWSLSFALNLTHLGNLQGTISLNGKNIEVKINTEHEDSLNAIHGYQNELANTLLHLGLNLRSWKLQVGLENNQIDAPSLNLLDIHV